jgi:hypothetical protein
MGGIGEGASAEGTARARVGSSAGEAAVAGGSAERGATVTVVAAGGFFGTS